MNQREPSAEPSVPVEVLPPGGLADGPTRWRALNILLRKVQGAAQIIRHFRNPFLVLALRLGLLRLPLFLYRITVGSRRYAMLGRPNAASLTDMFVLREVLILETYRDLLPLLKPGPLRLVDVGGNIGSFTVWLHSRHGLREGYCFEPDPGSFNLCRFNLARNGCSMVQVFPQAAGGHARRITMRTNTRQPGSHSIYNPGNGAEDATPVEVVAFPEWLASIPGELDVLKLDCEGAEWEILDAMPAGMFRRFGAIVAEVHGDPNRRHALDDFPDAMDRMGFKTVRWDGCDPGLYVGQRVNPA